MIREVNKGKRLEWARKNKGDDLSNAIFDETIVQIETHQRFCKSGLKPRYVQTQAKGPNRGICVGCY